MFPSIRVGPGCPAALVRAQPGPTGSEAPPRAEFPGSPGVWFPYLCPAPFLRSPPRAWHLWSLECPCCQPEGPHSGLPAPPQARVPSLPCVGVLHNLPWATGFQARRPDPASPLTGSRSPGQGKRGVMMARSLPSGACASVPAPKAQLSPRPSPHPPLLPKPSLVAAFGLPPNTPLRDRGPSCSQQPPLWPCRVTVPLALGPLCPWQSCGDPYVGGHRAPEAAGRQRAPASRRAWLPVGSATMQVPWAF